ncbi:MAG: transglycosylase SLT domain-containing protein [Pseudomonadota bacterium]
MPMLSRLPLIIVTLCSLAACAKTPPQNVSNACDIFEEKRSWYRATKKAQKRWGMPKSLQLAIIRQESGFDASAKPKRGKFLFVFPGKRKSSARGYPQALDGTWDQYKKSAGNRGASRKNFRDAADFVAWYGAESRRRNGISLSDGYRQYLAYHEGWAGYARGTYRRKSTLKRAARIVDSTARNYQAQLSRCEKRFNRGIPLIPFI